MREQYHIYCEDTIMSFDDVKELGDWWNSAEQKGQRRKFKLSKSEVDSVVAIVTARRDMLINGGNGK